MNIKNACNIIERFAPLDEQCDWDNCGLIVGDQDAELRGILVCVDVTIDVVNEAIAKGCNLIVAHHPLIFNNLKKILADELTGKILHIIIKNEINIYACHTTCDSCYGGLNDTFAKKLNIVNCIPLPSESCSRYGNLQNKTTFAELIEQVKKITQEEYVRSIGKLDKLVYNVAIITGSGGRNEQFIYQLKEHNVDVFITSEVKHSVALLLKEMNIGLIEITHFAHEKHFIALMSEVLTKNINSNIVYESETSLNPYNA
ncbi:MAG: Nif3-like dinuclear metal center hexameric protein [Clostridia bacterium]